MKSRRRIPGIWMVSGAVVSFLIFALIVAKSQWHWMQLLIIPVILAIGAFVYTLAQVRLEQRLAAQGYQNDQESATQTQREDLLQTYLNRITELLLDKDLRSSQSDTEVRTIARAQTLTTLPKLDAQRKGGLIQFLSESQLVEIISLSGANLRGAYLNGTIVTQEQLDSARIKPFRDTSISKYSG